MAHLYGLGHTRVGVITGPLVSPLSRDRLAGAREAAAQRGLSQGLAVAVGDFSIESGAREAAALLETERPTAIFCFSDEMAMGALAALRARGLGCPADVSLVGFDDIRFARYLDPPLTTISQPTVEIGHEVVRLLLEVLAGRTGFPRHTTLPHALVARASTAPCAT
jgi:LacI family repressor for deo operon, udp, cdd, tsx, nupC, and nupG